MKLKFHALSFFFFIFFYEEEELNNEECFEKRKFRATGKDKNRVADSVAEVGTLFTPGGETPLPEFLYWQGIDVRGSGFNSSLLRSRTYPC
jgi:hypothetical protein